MLLTPIRRMKAMNTVIVVRKPSLPPSLPRPHLHPTPHYVPSILDLVNPTHLQRLELLNKCVRWPAAATHPAAAQISDKGVPRANLPLQKLNPSPEGVGGGPDTEPPLRALLSHVVGSTGGSP